MKPLQPNSSDKRLGSGCGRFQMKKAKKIKIKLSIKNGKIENNKKPKIYLLMKGLIYSRSRVLACPITIQVEWQFKKKLTRFRLTASLKHITTNQLLPKIT